MINPSICVVVPARNRILLTKRLLKAFKEQQYKNFTLVLIDDGSTDGSREYVKAIYKEVVLIEGDGNLWWTGATNLGVKYAIDNNYDYVLTINQDAVIGRDFLTKMVKTAIKYPKSLLGCTILREDNGDVWSVGGYLNWNSSHLFNLNFSDQSINVLKSLKNPFPAQILNGNGTLIPVQIFKDIGLYNDKFTPHYHADSEIVLRAASKGYKAYVCLDAFLINDIPTQPLITTKKDLIFWKKSDFFWKPLLYFYIKYGPKKYFLGFFRQYFHFFRNFKVVRGIYKLVSYYRKYKELSIKTFIKLISYSDILRRRIIKRKKYLINKQSNKIVFVDHSFHTKTKSNTFFINYLKKFFEVEIVLDDSWMGKDFPDLSFIDEKYLGVIFWQSIPSLNELKKIKNDNLIFVPMFDGYENSSYFFWRQYERLKIINFSRVLHNKLSRWGFNTYYLQRFPKPVKEIKWGDPKKIFFYNRVENININTVKALIGDENFKIHIHKTIDPNQKFIKPTKTDEIKYSITYSEWFENKEDKWKLAQESAIFIAPRITEGIGQGGLEAMARGRAVVAVNAPTMNEYIINHVNGYLYDINNPQQIDFSDVKNIQLNSYNFIKDGYKNWLRERKRIVEIIRLEN